ncbi:hypothetical protein [Longispora albida]|uniref:hypothetical protein n=1 Tax=Longispora albida TaxID=203523 RepID=UPI0003A36149|nr:hypothetical protein [Longispora albida]
MADKVQMAGTLIGVLVGAVITGGFGLLNLRVQRRHKLEAERREREAASAARAADALSRLLLLEPEPR